jgi:hypothetical protein
MADRALMRAVLWLLVAVSTPAGVASSQGAGEVVTEVWLHDVPGPPTGDFWHPAGALNVFNLRSVYPNVVVCARPFLGGSSSCAPVCMSFEGDTKLGGKLKSTECKRPLHLVLPATDQRMQIQVYDMNNVPGQLRIHAVMARVGVTDPATCPDAKPCEMPMQKGSLVLSFATASGTSAPAAAAPTSGKCQQPSKQWANLDSPSGLHGPYSSVEDAMGHDEAGGIAWANTATAEWGYVIVRDGGQKSGGYYTTPPLHSSSDSGVGITPRFTWDNYESSFAKAFVGMCANKANFYIAATVHTHPLPIPGEQLLGFINNFSEPDFNQAIQKTNVAGPPASLFCEADTSSQTAPTSSAAPSGFEKIVMINENDGNVRTFTAQAGDSVIPNDQISSISLFVRFNHLWRCYANRVKVIGQYHRPQ